MTNPFNQSLNTRRYPIDVPGDSLVIMCGERGLTIALPKEQATYAADAINNREALEERNAKLVAMLRTIEEAARKSDECPLCGYLTYRAPGEYHAKDCELAALLAEEKD